MAAMVFLSISVGFSGEPQAVKAEKIRCVVTSDTILSGMIASLLPPQRYLVDALLPPGQCPGHYDIKLSDIEKIKKANLVVSFKGMPFMNKTVSGSGALLLVDSDNRNWMAPDSYSYGLGLLADKLSQYFPDDKGAIRSRRDETIGKVNAGANSLIKKIKRMGISGKALIASSMQKEPLEWMGFRVVGEYSRPEAISAREIVSLSKIGKSLQATAVVDNLQSGPAAGKGIAETLGVPHVVLTNFPSEKGYLATLEENVDTIAAAVMRK